MKTSKTIPSLLAVAFVSIITSQLNATITLTPSDPNMMGGMGEVIPEPASVIAWALLFPIGAVGCWRRRRR